MAFESVVPDDWRYAVFVPMCRGKGERNDCKNYRNIILLKIKVIKVTKVEMGQGLSEGARMMRCLGYL